jgi:hypothetical protein
MWTTHCSLPKVLVVAATEINHHEQFPIPLHYVSGQQAVRGIIAEAHRRMVVRRHCCVGWWYLYNVTVENSRLLPAVLLCDQTSFNWFLIVPLLISCDRYSILGLTVLLMLMSFAVMGTRPFSEGFASFWSAAMLCLLSIGGTMIMRKFHNSMAVGFFMGGVVSISQMFFVLFLM